MYSVILMVALTSGGTAPDLGFNIGCNRAGCANGGGGYGMIYGVDTSCLGCLGSGYYGTARSNYNPSPARTGTGAETKESALPAKAILTVELPADAKLYIGEQLMTSSAATRSFSTPELEPGRSYNFVLRAEAVRDGKTFRESKKIVLRAGEQFQTSLTNLQPAVTPAANTQSSR
jgi:uncharacterized protein (TIGR03000 family)